MITDRMKDLATFFNIYDIVDCVQSAIDGDVRNMMKYGIDLRGYLSTEHTLGEKIVIIERQINLQSKECVGDAEKMKGTGTYRSHEQTFRHIDEWYVGLTKKQAGNNED